MTDEGSRADGDEVEENLLKIESAMIKIGVTDPNIRKTIISEISNSRGKTRVFDPTTTTSISAGYRPIVQKWFDIYDESAQNNVMDNDSRHETRSKTTEGTVMDDKSKDTLIMELREELEKAQQKLDEQEAEFIKRDFKNTFDILLGPDRNLHQITEEEANTKIEKSYRSLENIRKLIK